MKIIKKFLVIFISLCIVSSFAGCHKQGEIAVTVGDYEFTSAYYMCAFMAADGEAKTKIDEALEKTDKDSSDEETDYESQEIDGVKYSKWVKTRTIELLERTAAIKKFCAEKEIELTKEQVEEVEKNSSSYWNYGCSVSDYSYYTTNYGYLPTTPYSEYYGLNGISYDTYKSYMSDSYLSGLYFESLYSKGGEKEIPAEDIKAELVENYVLVDVISADFTDLEESKIESIKKDFDSYVASLEDGSMTFEEVYKDYYKEEEKSEELPKVEADITADKESKDEESKDEETKEEELTPQDKYATIIGTDKTKYASEYFDEVNEMEFGEVKLIELDDDAGLAIFVKLDITADEYYITNLDATLRYAIAQDEFLKDMEEAGAKLSTDVNKYAIGQFSVKKIKYPES